MARPGHIRAILAALIGTLLALTPGCGSDAESGADRTPGGAGGHSNGAVRLAVLSPALTITLDDLGLRDRIVGRHGFDLLLEDEVPVVGNELGLDYEALIGVEPTHVLLETNERGIPPRLVSLAEARRWLILTIPLHESVDQIRAGVERLVEVLPREVDPEAAEELRREMDRAWREREGLAARLGETLPLVGIDPPGALGPGSFHADLLGRLGAEPVPRDGAMFIRMSAEDVVRLDPDSIILFLPGAQPDGEGAIGVLGRIGLRAVEEGRVLLITHPHCLTPSTAMIEVADEIVREAMALDPLEGPGAEAAP